MQVTQSAAAIGTTKPDTTSTSQSDEPLVKDVTTEILGERRAEWREGFDAGMKQGTTRTLHSPALEQIVLELVLQRATFDVGAQREKLLAHWKSEAQWWREEHDKVHAEYCAFVKDIARRFAK